MNQLVHSLLDRLSDVSPLDKIKSRSQIVYELCEHVRQDLENLLNTKRRCVGWNEKDTQLEKSVLNYGIDDFMNKSFDSTIPEEQICANFEYIICLFEPRLTHVKVFLSEKFVPFDRCLKFRIEANLYVKPVYEAVQFNSTLVDQGKHFSVTQESI